MTFRGDLLFYVIFVIADANSSRQVGSYCYSYPLYTLGSRGGGVRARKCSRAKGVVLCAGQAPRVVIFTSTRGAPGNELFRFAHAEPSAPVEANLDAPECPDDADRCLHGPQRATRPQPRRRLLKVSTHHHAPLPSERASLGASCTINP